MIKFNIGDLVRVIDHDDLSGRQRKYLGKVGVVTDKSGIPGVKFDDGVHVDFGQRKLERAIPESPFNVVADGGWRYKVEVDGAHYSLTSAETGRHFPKLAETSKIPGFISSGRWLVIDEPTPAVDPVNAAVENYQRLLREHAEAIRLSDEADAVAEKAAENRRNIGKMVAEAKRELDKANHVAVGIGWDDMTGPKYSA